MPGRSSPNICRTGRDGGTRVIGCLPALTEKGWTGKELKIGEEVRVVDAYLEAREGSTTACCANIYDMAGREFYTGTATARGLNAHK